MELMICKGVWFNIIEKRFCDYAGRNINVEKCLIKADIIKNMLSKINRSKLSDMQLYIIDNETTLFAMCRAFEFEDIEKEFIPYIHTLLEWVEELELKNKEEEEKYNKYFKKEEN